MKPNIVLVNSARRGVVDEQALAEALRNHKIHSAAFDVLSVEPVNPDHPLLKLPNFLITPHMAGLTQEAATRVATMAAEGVLAVLHGEKWPHVANKEAHEHPK